MADPKNLFAGVAFYRNFLQPSFQSAAREAAAAVYWALEAVEADIGRAESQ